jgi:hypothetical protein
LTCAFSSVALPSNVILSKSKESFRLMMCFLLKDGKAISVPRV